MLTGLAVVALAAGRLRPGTDAFVQRVVLRSAVPTAGLSASVLLFTIGGIRRRALAAVAGLVAARALLLPALVLAGTDASSEANGFAGCGTFLEPTPISTAPGSAAECDAALDHQRMTVGVLAVPAAVTALLSLAHAAGGLRPGGRHRQTTGHRCSRPAVVVRDVLCASQQALSRGDGSRAIAVLQRLSRRCALRRARVPHTSSRRYRVVSCPQEVAALAERSGW